MRYLMLLKHTEDYRGKTIPPGLLEAMDQFVGENTRNGKFIDTNGLKSSHKGKKVQLRGGKIHFVDGPFTESKEIVGGYAMVEAESDQEALDPATQFMELHRIHWPGFEGESEVRPVETGDPAAD